MGTENLALRSRVSLGNSHLGGMSKLNEKLRWPVGEPHSFGYHIPAYFLNYPFPNNPYEFILRIYFSPFSRNSIFSYFPFLAIFQFLRTAEFWRR